MRNSIAVDKVKKRNARSTIYQLDLLMEPDCQLLEQWMHSGLLLWLHLAPVCGTASRARHIRGFDNDPQPLRSEAWPEGLPIYILRILSVFLSPTVCFKLHVVSSNWRVL